jgi:ABC-type spermidine/putrescine transport system permease subunit I
MWGLLHNVLVRGAEAVGPSTKESLLGLKTVAEKLRYNLDATLPGVAASLIKTFLSLLGIIFVGMILFAGYNWMTAMGEKDKVQKARDTLIAAAIGLVIIISAYAITTFLFEALKIS